MSVFNRLPNTDIRSMAITAYGGSGMAFPAWRTNLAALANGSGATSGTNVSGAIFPGFVGACPDGSSGAWLLQFTGSLIDLTSGGATLAYAAPSGAIFAGLTALGSSAYGVDTSGNVYGITSHGVFSNLGTFGVPANGLTGSGALLYSILQSISGVGTFNPTSLTSGVVSSPFSGGMMCLAASGAASGAFALGGYAAATLASGFSTAQLDPTNSLLFAGATPAALALSLWTNNGTENWAFTQLATGAGNTSSLSWAPSGTSVFASDTVSGAVRVFNYSLGILSLAQTLGVVGAAAVAAMLDGQTVLACQPSQNSITTLYASGATWVVSGATIPLANPQSVIAQTPIQAAVGYASGIAYLTNSAGIWSVTSTGALPFVPNYLALDYSGNVVAAGTSGAIGVIYAGGVTGAFSGSVSGMIFQQGQIVVADATNSVLRVFESFNGAITQQQTYPFALAPTALFEATRSIFLAGSGTTNIYEFLSPWTLAAMRTGKVSAYNGSLWNTTNLPVNQIPQTVAFDASGNISVATLLNAYYTISPTGGIVTSGIIAQDAQQPATTPIGIASLLWLNGKLFGTSTLNEALVEVV